MNEALASGEAKRVIDDDGDELITWKEGKIGTRSGWKGSYALKGQKKVTKAQAMEFSGAVSKLGWGFQIKDGKAMDKQLKDGDAPKMILEKLDTAVKGFKKATTQAEGYFRLLAAVETTPAIEGCKTGLIKASTACKSWQGVFEQMILLQVDAEGKPLSLPQVVADVNKAADSLTALFEQCELAKVHAAM